MLLKELEKEREEKGSERYLCSWRSFHLKLHGDQQIFLVLAFSLPLLPLVLRLLVVFVAVGGIGVEGVVGGVVVVVVVVGDIFGLLAVVVVVDAVAAVVPQSYQLLHRSQTTSKKKMSEV